MTAIADMVSRADRQHLEDRRRELALSELDRLMRQPGGLAGSPEPPPLHEMGRDATRESPTASPGTRSARRALSSLG
jgi:hypothetical protein